MVSPPPSDPVQAIRERLIELRDGTKPRSRNERELFEVETIQKTLNVVLAELEALSALGSSASPSSPSASEGREAIYQLVVEMRERVNSDKRTVPSSQVWAWAMRLETLALRYPFDLDMLAREIADDAATDLQINGFLTEQDKESRAEASDWIVLVVRQHLGHAFSTAGSTVQASVIDVESAWAREAEQMERVAEARRDIEAVASWLRSFRSNPFAGNAEEELVDTAHGMARKLETALRGKADPSSPEGTRSPLLQGHHHHCAKVVWTPHFENGAGFNDANPCTCTPSPAGTRQVEVAERIAREAHRGQKEESTGDDYIRHVERVVVLVSADPDLRASERDDAAAVAWLHDVIEDSDWTAERLMDAGLSHGVVSAVVELTRVPPYDYALYIDQIRDSGKQLAIRVKLADLRDHLRPNCPERLRPRYERALATLESK